MRLTTEAQVCHPCAEIHGWKWPDGQMAHWRHGKCYFCGRQRSVTFESLWIRDEKKVDPIVAKAQPKNVDFEFWVGIGLLFLVAILLVIFLVRVFHLSMGF